MSGGGSPINLHALSLSLFLSLSLSFSISLSPDRRVVTSLQDLAHSCREREGGRERVVMQGRERESQREGEKER